jgi:hypothetical protein
MALEEEVELANSQFKSLSTVTGQEMVLPR